ncbi:MAG TPA: hypothetical protein VGH89_21835 [Pseudonocardia sp.]
MTGEQQVSDPDEIAVYLRALVALREAALLGRDAVDLIRRVIGQLAKS